MSKAECSVRSSWRCSASSGLSSAADVRWQQQQQQRQQQQQQQQQGEQGSCRTARCRPATCPGLQKAASPARWRCVGSRPSRSRGAATPATHMHGEGRQPASHQLPRCYKTTVSVCTTHLTCLCSAEPAAGPWSACSRRLRVLQRTAPCSCCRCRGCASQHAGRQARADHGGSG